jgi:hypothetical protein
MTIQEVTILLQKEWMEKSVEDRIRAAGNLYQAEKALLERLAPPDFSDEDKRQFVYYHMHGEEMPEGARRS